MNKLIHIYIYVYMILEDYSTMQGKSAFRFNINKLYNTICKIPNTDEVTLLLYMLLHRNSSVKQDIMRRPDIQLLVCINLNKFKILIY